MVEIKTNETHLERRIKIKRQQFDALLIMRTTWLHLDSSPEIQRPQLNRNDSLPCVSSKTLIKDLNVDRTVTPNSSYE